MTRSRKRAGRRRKYPVLIIGAAGAVAVILAITLPLIQKKQAAALGNMETQVQESITHKESGSIQETPGKTAAVTVEDTVITGLSGKEAQETLEKKYSGPVKIQGPDGTEELVNPVDNEIERLIQSIPSRPEEELKLSFDYGKMEEDVRGQVSALAGKWDRKPSDSKVVSFDKKTGVYEYSKEENGRTLNQDQLIEDIMKMVKEKNYTAPAEAGFTVTAPARTQAQAKAQYKVIGTFKTKLTSNKNRNKNVTLAAEAIDGLILQPGEEFSFNNTTGNRTKEKGYQPAGAYRNGVLIEEPGGGVCQVSTTLYHSIIEAGFKTTERNAHSFAPSYVEKGQDAMVSFDGYAGPDLKFVNTSAAPVVLRAAVDGLELKLSIVGIPVLEDGVKVSIKSEKVKDTDPASPSYEENVQLPFGTERVVDQGQSGSVWKSFRIVTKDGKVIKEEPLHNSYYKSKAGKIERNTTVPQPVLPAESGSAQESVPEAGQPSGTEQSGLGAGDVTGPAEVPQPVEPAQTAEPADPAGAADASGPAGAAGPGQN